MKQQFFMIIIGVIFCGCKSDVRDKISARVEQQCKTSEENTCVTIVALKDITDFKWDKFYYFNIGTSLDTINAVLGFPYPYWEDLSESLIFVSGDNVVYHEEYAYPDPEGKAKGGFYFDIGSEKGRHYYTPLTGIFRVSSTIEEGHKYYTIFSAVNSP